MNVAALDITNSTDLGPAQYLQDEPYHLLGKVLGHREHGPARVL